MTSFSACTSDRPATRLPSWVRGWFALNAFVVLFPPIYWASNAYGSDLAGLPANLFFFVAACTSVTCSVVVAYLLEYRRGPAR